MEAKASTLSTGKNGLVVDRNEVAFLKPVTELMRKVGVCSFFL
jgi:hypothetical protein